MSLAIIFLCVFDTMFPLIVAMVLSAISIDEHMWDFAAYNALLSGCLIVIIDLELGITVMPEWEATVAYTATAFTLAFFTGLIAGLIQWEIQQKLHIQVQVEDKWDLIRKINDY
jgi:hypothetical protein